jgi:hypothetical protein
LLLGWSYKATLTQSHRYLLFCFIWNETHSRHWAKKSDAIFKSACQFTAKTTKQKKVRIADCVRWSSYFCYSWESDEEVRWRYRHRNVWSEARKSRITRFFFRCFTNLELYIIHWNLVHSKHMRECMRYTKQQQQHLYIIFLFIVSTTTEHNKKRVRYICTMWLRQVWFANILALNQLF